MRGSLTERFLKWFSLGRVVFWSVVAILAYVYGWLESVAFVAVASLYANIASDFAAWRADDNPAFERIEERLEHVEELLRELLRRQDLSDQHIRAALRQKPLGVPKRDVPVTGDEDRWPYREPGSF